MKALTAHEQVFLELEKFNVLAGRDWIECRFSSQAARLAGRLENERRFLDLARPAKACSIRRKNGASTSRDIQPWPRPIRDDDQFGGFTRVGFFGADCRESISQLSFPSVSRARWEIGESCATSVPHVCGKVSGPNVD